MRGVGPGAGPVRLSVLEVRQAITRRLRLELARMRFQSEGWVCTVRTGRSGCCVRVEMDHFLQMHASHGDALEATGGADASAAADGVAGVGRRGGGGGGGGGGGRRRSVEVDDWGEDFLDRESWEAAPRDPPKPDELNAAVRLAWPSSPESLLPRDVKIEWLCMPSKRRVAGEEEESEEEDSEAEEAGEHLLDLRVDLRLALLLEQLFRRDAAFFDGIDVVKCERRSKEEELALRGGEHRVAGEHAGGLEGDESDEEGDGDEGSADDFFGLRGEMEGRNQCGLNQPPMPPHPYELGRERRVNAEYRCPQPKRVATFGTRSRSSDPRSRMYCNGGANPTTPMESLSRTTRVNLVENWQPEDGARVRIYRLAKRDNPAATLSASASAGLLLPPPLKMRHSHDGVTFEGTASRRGGVTSPQAGAPTPLLTPSRSALEMRHQFVVHAAAATHATSLVTKGVTLPQVHVAGNGPPGAVTLVSLHAGAQSAPVARSKAAQTCAQGIESGRGKGEGGKAATYWPSSKGAVMLPPSPVLGPSVPTSLPAMLPAVPAHRSLPARRTLLAEPLEPPPSPWPTLPRSPPPTRNDLAEAAEAPPL